MPVNVGIIEDHSELRLSLEYLVSSFSGYELAWSYSSVEDTLKNFTETDIILLDVNISGISGIDAIPLIKRKSARQKIIILTILEDSHHLLKAIQNGADGYVLKSSGPSKILDTINDVSEGGATLTPLVAKQVMMFLKPRAVRSSSPANLTTREKEILILIIQEMTNEMIASRLIISSRTVRSHIKNIYEKVRIHSPSQVSANALNEKSV